MNIFFEKTFHNLIIQIRTILISKMEQKLFEKLLHFVYSKKGLILF